VLCLDSAYHFNPRSKFFHDAYKLLKPGGVLALVDIVFVPSSQFLRSTSLLQQLIFKIAQSMLGLPTSNLLNESEYESSLANVGFEAIRINPVDHSGERTFKPLVKHIKTIVATYEAILNPLIIAKYNAVAFCFESLATKGWFRFVEVSAKRPW
jgi:cyclopropane fatty-acyl-phospholipid synthase-like methyltransferase